MVLENYLCNLSMKILVFTINIARYMGLAFVFIVDDESV